MVIVWIVELGQKHSSFQVGPSMKIDLGFGVKAGNQLMRSPPMPLSVCNISYEAAILDLQVTSRVSRSSVLSPEQQNI